MNEVPEDFWTGVDKDKYGSEAEFRSAVMEQCKLYIGLVESNRNRRAAANSFFLGLNTAVFVAIGVFWETRPSASKAALVFPLVVLLVQCFAWASAVVAYRKAGERHWDSVRFLEEELPSRSAQWQDGPYGGPGRLTDIERSIPALFAVTYLGAFIAAIAL